MNELELLGSEIRRRRHLLSISQEALANNCGFDRTYISLLERGQRNPSLLNLIKLSSGLKVTVSDLLKVIR